MKKIILAASAALAFGLVANAQTNLQTFYDFGKDRQYVTTTFEMFKGDKWGNTFFFIDHYYANKAQYDAGAAGNMNGTYYEIERCLNFWQDTKLAPLSLELEYDGGSFGSSVFCAGLNYFMHSADFSRTFNIALLYTKNFGYDTTSCPIKLSGVWGIQDFLGVNGLRFSGFIDVWGINRTWDKNGYLFLGNPGQVVGESTKFSVLTEPQLWYNVGRFFGCENLNIGGEVELSYNFSGASQGFVCNPCAGVKWIF